MSEALTEQTVAREVEEQLEAAVNRVYLDALAEGAEDEDGAVTPPWRALDADTPLPSGLGEGSEAEMRECEAVCPVTNLTYNRHLPSNPWVGPDGIAY